MPGTGAGRVGERAEVPAPALRRRTVVVLSDEVVEQHLPKAGQLFEPAVVTPVSDGERKQFESTIEGIDAVRLVARRPPVEGSLHFTADVGKLFDQRELLPAALRQ